MTLTFQDDRASLTLSGGPSPLDFDLSKVPGPEAASRLRALTLGLAERLCSLERQLAGKRGWRWGGVGGVSHLLSGPPTRASISAFPQLRRRRHPPAPARAPGRWALSTSCQVRPVTRTWIGARFPQSKAQPPEEGSMCVALGSRWIQEPPLPVSPRPGSSERWPWTWGQEMVPRRVSHQPRLQEVPRHPCLLCPGFSPSTPIMPPPLLSQEETRWWCRLR